MNDFLACERRRILGRPFLHQKSYLQVERRDNRE